MRMIPKENFNENGSTMALVLMIMASILVIGMIATHESVVESRIVRNYADAKDNFYRGEGAAKEALQLMDNSNSPATDLFPGSGAAFAWVQPFGFNVTTAGPGTVVDSTLVDNAEYLVIYDGVAAGSNLNMADPTRLHQYVVYGRGFTGLANDPSDTTIEIGYRRRF